MNEDFLQTAPPRNGFVELMCWAWIALLVFGLMALHFVGPMASEEPKSEGGVPLELVQIELLGKMIVVAKDMSKDQNGNTPVLPVDDLNQGTVEQRLGAVILSLEQGDSASAQDLFNAIKQTIKLRGYIPSKDQQRLMEIVTHIIDTRADAEFWDSNEVPTADREFLTSKLGWVGQLALTPANSTDVKERQRLISDAWFAAVSLIFLGLFLILVALSGLACFIGLLAFFAMRKANWSCPRDLSSGTIYLETFALWLTAFVGLQLVVGLVGIPAALALPVSVVIFFMSMTTLIRPIWRVRSFAQLRQDIGWIAPRPVSHVVSGISSYLGTLPLLAAAMFVSAIIAGVMMSFSDHEELAGGPTPGAHPIIEMVSKGDLWSITWVFLAAAVAAPIVEETFFRGVLFRYLQDATSRQPGFVAFGVSAVVNSFIFAAIHPQGLVGIPVLMMLAIGFSLSRQWQNSLLPAVLVHGIHNFSLLVISFLLLA